MMGEDYSEDQIGLDDVIVAEVLQLSGFIGPIDDALLPTMELERVAASIRTGTHRKGEAQKLMDAFVKFHDSGQKIPPDLLKYVRDSFADHLNGATLGAAFGTTLPKGQPPTEKQKLLNLAVEMWNKRVIERKSYQESLDEIESTFYQVRSQSRKEKSSRKVIEDAWREYLHDGLIYFKALIPLSKEQEARVIEVLENVKK